MRQKKREKKRTHCFEQKEEGRKKPTQIVESDRIQEDYL
jgi:hypothetical protein